MFSKLVVQAGLGMTMTLGSLALADSFKVVKAEHLSIFVPRGFDDNDELSVVIDGFLPSTCHKLDKIEYKLDLEAHRLTIEQLVRQYDEYCVDVPVPFTNVLRLSALPMGSYSVSGAGGRTIGLFHVSESRNAGPDDYLYAPVEQVSIQQAPGSNRRYAVLEGRFTNTCMVWDEIKVIDSSETIEVLPTIKMEERSDCVETDQWFKTSVDLPAKSELGRYLVHVRSLNGKSENRMFSVGPARIHP